MKIGFALPSSLKMLTRHFYELEEVSYALLECLRYKKAEMAVFWAREIILSQEDDQLTKTMIQAWIIYMGADRIDWLDAWFQIDQDDGGCHRLVLVAEFCNRVGSKRARINTFWIACRGFSSVASEERVALALTQNDPFCLYWWLGPSYEKKPTALMTTLRSFVDSPELFDSLSKAIALKLSLHLRMLLTVCAVQLLCLESYPDPLVTGSEAFVADLLSTWSFGYCSSRLFTITAEQLPRGYKRVLQSVVCESPLNIMETGCAFWKSIKNLILDDDSLEMIVDMYFPDDIPDEWSVAERLKSHPLTLDVYNIHIKPEYRIKMVWSPRHVPQIKKAWIPCLKLLFKACGVPDR